MGRKPVRRPIDPSGDGQMLKMKELIKATGVNRATVLFYVSKGLLPEPVKTSPNIAYYSSSVIERIRLIRQLQSTHRFSLEQIRIILLEKDKGRDIESLIEFNKEIYSEEENTILNKKSFCLESGLTKEQVEKAISLDLLLPKSDDSFDSLDLAVGRALKEEFEEGISYEELFFYPNLADKIVEKEIELRNKIILDKSYDESLNITIKVTQKARLLRKYYIERKFERIASRQPLTINR